MNRIELHNVSVTYPVHRVRSFKEWAIRTLAGDRATEIFHALDDINLTVGAGQALGIVGPNGAGKSTLLRLIAGIIPPSRGYTVLRGAIAPLVDLGTGFDSEMSGIENIYFNGALLGRSRATMKRKITEIVDFSGLAEFIDQPLRTYSTGMVARLAFSIATTIEADIVLLDEILSVGDAGFKQRCQDRIRTFYQAGATVILVSHDLEAISEMCEQSIWVNDGKIAFSGPSWRAIEKYILDLQVKAGLREPELSGA